MVGLLAPLAVLPAAPALIADLPGAAAVLAASFLRMVAAYALSLAFSLGIGYAAATHRMAERVVIPILDILQSIPILGFFPFAVIAFVELSGPGSLIGPNLAAIFLVFTSMTWNMAFGVYESIKGLPQDMDEASRAFGLHGIHRIRTVMLPATVNRLVYNSILSWTAGWYYLVGAEIISVGPLTLHLPGIGSYLYTAASARNLGQLFAGALLLIVLIAALDLFIWRPLGEWAERYRYDQTPSAEMEGLAPGRIDERVRKGVSTVAQGFLGGMNRLATPIVNLGTVTVGRIRRRTHLPPGVIRYVLVGGILVVSWFMLIAIIVAVFRVVSGPIAPSIRSEIDLIPLALGASFTRVVLAYLLSLAVCLPIAFALIASPNARKLGMPVIEVIASFPAPAIFPLLLVSLAVVLGLQATVIIAVMTGMIWYLFFNIYSGLRAIPPDLQEAAKSLGLKGRLGFLRLTFPAIYPAFITGSITAFGGGWNSLIYAEYLATPTGSGNCQSQGVLGLGQLLSIGTYCFPSSSDGLPLMVFSLFTLVGAVIAVNELLWKPLYRRSRRYKIE